MVGRFKKWPRDKSFFNFQLYRIKHTSYKATWQ